jgi:hypothetical protein
MFIISMKKRGISTVITSLVLVLLSVIILVVIGFIVKNAVGENTDKFITDQFTTDLKISAVKIIDENNIQVTVKREVGEGNLVGIVFILYDSDESEIVRKEVTMKELEEKNFEIILEVVNAKNIQKIAIAPIFGTDSGKKVTGDVQSEKISSSFSSGGVSGSSETGDTGDTGDIPEETANCDLISATVSPSSVTQGENVLVTLGGTNCEEEFLTIEVFEQDGFLNSDDHVLTNPIQIEFSENAFCTLCTSQSHSWCDDDNTCYENDGVESCTSGTEINSPTNCPTTSDSNTYGFYWNVIYNDGGESENPPLEYYFRATVVSDTSEQIESTPILEVYPNEETPQECSETCESLSYSCGVHSICGEQIYCGVCSSCELDSVYLSSDITYSAPDTAIEGDLVDILLTGTDCDGTELNFKFYEKDDHPFKDDFVEDYLTINLNDNSLCNFCLTNFPLDETYWCSGGFSRQTCNYGNQPCLYAQIPITDPSNCPDSREESGQKRYHLLWDAKYVQDSEYGEDIFSDIFLNVTVRGSNKFIQSVNSNNPDDYNILKVSRNIYCGDLICDSGEEGVCSDCPCTSEVGCLEGQRCVSGICEEINDCEVTDISWDVQNYILNEYGQRVVNSGEEVRINFDTNNNCDQETIIFLICSTNSEGAVCQTSEELKFKYGYPNDYGVWESKILSDNLQNQEEFYIVYIDESGLLSTLNQEYLVVLQ